MSRNKEQRSSTITFDHSLLQIDQTFTMLRVCFWLLVISYFLFVPRDYTRLIEPTLSRPPDGNKSHHIMQYGGRRNRTYYNSTLRGFRISGSFDFAALLVWNLSIFGSQVSSPSWTKTMAFLGKHPRNKNIWRRTRYDV